VLGYLSTGTENIEQSWTSIFSDFKQIDVPMHTLEEFFTDKQ
jgi:hypothetical protein